MPKRWVTAALATVASGWLDEGIQARFPALLRPARRGLQRPGGRDGADRLYRGRAAEPHLRAAGRTHVKVGSLITPPGRPLFKRKTGTLVRARDARRRLRRLRPLALPPRLPVKVDPGLLAEAERRLLRLDALSALLPDVGLFTYSFVRKEALFLRKSRDPVLLRGPAPLRDPPGAGRSARRRARGVDCVAALEQAHRALRTSGCRSPCAAPIERPGARTRAEKTPGRYRRNQVWIGDRLSVARFVPPP